MFFYLSGTFLAFFLSFVLITKRNKTYADYILLGWLFVTGFHLFTFYLFFTGRYTDFPTFILLGFPLPLAQGPFLYTYTRQQTSSAGYKKKYLLHFLPVLVSYLLFIKFYFLTPEQKTEVFKQNGSGFEIPMLINLYAIFISGIIYIALSIKQLVKYKRSIVHQFSNTEKINFNWLLYLIIWMTGIWIVILFIGDDKLIFGCAAVFILWLGYFSIKQVQVFNSGVSQVPIDTAVVDKYIETAVSSDTTDNTKYQKSPLTEQEASFIHQRLKKVMTTEKPFTNPDLTLNELAKTLEVHPNYLSQVINSKENKSFYDLVNELRVEEFIQLIMQSVNQQYTLLGVAYDCGFNSKASFNRNFKKYTGYSPSEYLKQQLVLQL